MADTATAPYNFVILPRKVLPSPMEENHAQHLNDDDATVKKSFREYIRSREQLSGEIVLHISTKTPLFIGGNGDKNKHFAEMDGRFNTRLAVRGSLIAWHGDTAYIITGNQRADKLKTEKTYANLSDKDKKRAGKQFIRFTKISYVDWSREHWLEIDDEVLESYEHDRNRRGVDLFKNSGILKRKQLEAMVKNLPFRVVSLEPCHKQLDKKLNHWDSPSAQIRGYKMYWHNSDVDWQAGGVDKKMNVGKEGYKNLLKTITPLNAGNNFVSKIRFSNLSKIELGALLMIFDLSGNGKNAAYKIGQGKPPELGSIKVETELFVDGVDAYEKIFNANGWENPLRADNPQIYLVNTRRTLRNLFTAK